MKKKRKKERIQIAWTNKNSRAFENCIRQSSLTVSETAERKRKEHAIIFMRVHALALSLFLFPFFLCLGWAFVPVPATSRAALASTAPWKRLPALRQHRIQSGIEAEARNMAKIQLSKADPDFFAVLQWCSNLNSQKNEGRTATVTARRRLPRGLSWVDLRSDFFFFF